MTKRASNHSHHLSLFKSAKAFEAWRLRTLSRRPQHQAFAAGLGAAGCCSTRSMAMSRQAQPGALAAQILVLGFTDEGSSRLPARTTLNCGRAEDLAKSCEPQRGQNWRVIWLPLSAVLEYSARSPE